MENRPRFDPSPYLDHVNLRWNRACPHCGIALLTGETPGFCCGPHGSRLYDVRRLPPLPAEYNHFIHDPTISANSRRLNLLFSFAALQTTAAFPNTRDGFLAIQGKLYHQIRPNHERSGIRWVLYDGYMRDAAPGGEAWLRNIPSIWTDAVTAALTRLNPLTRSLQTLATMLPDAPEANIALRDNAAAEVAAIMRYDNSAIGDITPRTLVIAPRTADGREARVRVPTISRLWEPLAYPLLFPHGTLGWGVVGADNADQEGNAVYDNDVETTQIWWYRHRLLQEPRFSIFGRLTNEYLVDMFSRNLETRLHYIRQNQERLRRQDAMLMDGGDGVPSENVFLPASFLGSRRWASEQVADALAIAAVYGSPTFFVTMTCNPRWPEIAECLRPGQTFSDIPLVVARVFAQKLSLLMVRLRELFPGAGDRQYSIQVVEFQKRGLPHAHILIKFRYDCSTADDIDAAVSAEMPADPADAALVQEFMMHSHSPYCQRERNGRVMCRFGYPKPIVPNTYVDDEGRVQYRRRTERDTMVVPFSIHLLRLFRCHINCEVASPSQIFQYMFKYIHKGPDRAHFTVVDEDEYIDEIEQYWSGRYLSAGEAAYRILGKHITRKYPAVTPLPVHIPGSHTFRQYARRDGNESRLSLLDRYFLRPVGNFLTEDHMPRPFSDLRYSEYYTLFRHDTWDGLTGEDRLNGHFLERQDPEGGRRKRVIQRDPGRPHISRIMMQKPSAGEAFFVRALLHHKAAASFEDLRTIDGTLYDTFQEAVEAVGLFVGHREADETIAEAVAALRTPHELRLLFVDLLTADSCHSPIRVWETFRAQFSFDLLLQNNRNVELAEQLALESIADILALRGRTLEEFGLPVPRRFPREVLLELRRWNANPAELQERARNARGRFTGEQLAIHDEVMHAVRNSQPLCLFIDGQAGRGKTFLLNAITDAVRALGMIVIPTATSAYAAQLYPGGRTAHTAFKIPVNDDSEMLESPIEPNDSRASLLREMALFIWDEVPMANRAAVACVDDVCRRVMGNELPFGGKISIFVGDFRQTGPVIVRGSRAQVVDASIRSSPLWETIQVRQLTIPIRNAEDPPYAAFVDWIGNGGGPDVPVQGVIPTVSLPSDVVDFVFPEPIRRDPETSVRRSILAPTNTQVNEYNDIVLELLDGDPRTFYAADSIKEFDGVDGLDADAAIPLLDYAARRTLPGIPAHALTIKPGGVFRLMRNLAPERGCVKNMRCVIDDIGRRLITVRLIRPDNGNRLDEHTTLLPRIPHETRLDSGHTLIRRQFPLAPAYATTFNGCQGLTLDRVGVDLTRNVFSHGQLYTALSRVRNRDCVVARLLPDSSSTINVTYHELLL